MNTIPALRTGTEKTSCIEVAEAEWQGAEELKPYILFRGVMLLRSSWLKARPYTVTFHESHRRNFIEVVMRIMHHEAMRPSFKAFEFKSLTQFSLEFPETDALYGVGTSRWTWAVR